MLCLPYFSYMFRAVVAGKNQSGHFSLVETNMEGTTNSWGSGGCCKPPAEYGAEPRRKFEN